MKRIIPVLVVMLIISSFPLGSVCAEPNSSVNFKDIKASDWFAEAVGKLNALKIIDGLPGGLFSPKSEVTRGQFAKMLVQAMGYRKVDSVSFDDIIQPTTGKAHWASVYVETALRNSVIVKDELGSNFYPEVPIKRADMFVMMFRALKLQPSTGENPFADLIEANSTFTKLYEEYLVRGTTEDGKRLFKPYGLTTRAEAAVVIARMLDYKENPAEFVARMGMEERFANGTQTAEDIALKREMEIEKAKADTDYIMEPIVKIVNSQEAIRNFKLMAGAIGILNFEDYLNYTPDCQFKIICTNKDKDLLNKVTWLTQPFISYDHVYEVRTDLWKDTKDAGVEDDIMQSYIIRYIMRDEEKAINGKWADVPNYIKKGDVLNYKLNIKRGNNIKEYDIAFTVN